MTICLSACSKKNPCQPCKNKACPESVYCKKHLKSPVALVSPEDNPLLSENDTDIVTLERIYTEKDGVRTLEKGIKLKEMFTYRIEISGRTHQRSLNIRSMKNLIDKNCYEPFSNIPFPVLIIEKAKDLIVALKIKEPLQNKVEQLSVLQNNLVSRFHEIGYFVNIEHIKKMKKKNYLSWYREFKDFYWRDFKLYHTEVALLIYPLLDLPELTESNIINSSLEIYNEICINHIQGTQLVIQALAQCNKYVKESFPDIT